MSIIFYHLFLKCLPQGWYIAADFQLYIVSYLVILLLYRRPKIGFALITLGILITPVLQGANMYMYNTAVYWDFSTNDYL